MPIIAPTPICIMSLNIGDTRIGLFPIVSISSIKLTRDIPIPIASTIKSLFSKRGEKSQKIKMSGVRMSSAINIDIPAQ